MGRRLLADAPVEPWDLNVIYGDGSVVFEWGPGVEAEFYTLWIRDVSTDRVRCATNGDFAEGSTKKVNWKLEGNCTRIDGLAPLGDGTEAPLGLKWTSVGPAKPSSGTELTNKDLASALHEKTVFTQEEWETFGIGNVRLDDFINVANSSDPSYFQPQGVRAPPFLFFEKADGKKANKCSGKFEFFVLGCSRSASNATGRAVDCELDQPSKLLQLEISCDRTIVELVDQVSNNASVQSAMASIVMASIVMAYIVVGWWTRSLMTLTFSNLPAAWMEKPSSRQKSYVMTRLVNFHRPSRHSSPPLAITPSGHAYLILTKNKIWFTGSALLRCHLVLV